MKRRPVRDVVQLCAIALLVACVRPAVVKNPPSVVIDMHSHMFNARYLPLREIFVSRGVPREAASGLEKILLALCGDSHLAEAAGLAQSPVAVEGNALKVASRNFQPNRVARELVVQEEFRSTPIEANLTPGESESLKRFVRSRQAIQTLALGDQDLTWEEIAKALEMANILGESTRIEPRSLTGKANGYLRFIGTMLADEKTIAATARKTYPNVDLFVHHMMDLERTYGEKPSIEFERQVAKMLALDADAQSKTLTFAAFDPFRRADALPLAEKAYSEGVAGFKFYPPCGYRPAGNDCIPDRRITGTIAEQWDSRYKGVTGDDLNKWNAGFFQFCESHEVPIFVHCTDHGFEAVSGYGQSMADPALWNPCFERHPNLRVCFAHAGGEAGWFSEIGSSSPTFTDSIVDRCERSSNAYCEVGYLAPILKPEGAELFRQNLVVRLRTHPGLAKKLMYGTDWHMLTQEEGHEEYLARMNKIFDSPELRFMKADFFAGNAARFLRLRELANDPRLSHAVRERLASIAAKIAE